MKKHEFYNDRIKLLREEIIGDVLYEMGLVQPFGLCLPISPPPNIYERKTAYNSVYKKWRV
jgi:hypothetical protein